MTGWKRTQKEPSLDELLADEIMTPVIRSAGTDRAALRCSLAETARRIGAGTGGEPDREAA